MGKKRFEVKGTGCYSEQVCDIHDVEWRMVFGLTYLDFCVFLKISIYFLWPLIELVLQLCNEIIQLKFYHYFLTFRAELLKAWLALTIG